MLFFDDEEQQFFHQKKLYVRECVKILNDKTHKLLRLKRLKTIY